MKPLSFLFLLLAVGTVAGGRGDSTDDELYECDLYIDGHCYWTFVQKHRNIDYPKAEQICEDGGSTPAVIHSLSAYREILDEIRNKLPQSQTWTAVWTGMKFNPMTREQTPNDAYWHWFHIPSDDDRAQIPWAGFYFVRPYTHVYLEVKKLARSRYQGLINREPSAKKRGVVCEKELD